MNAIDDRLHDSRDCYRRGFIQEAFDSRLTDDATEPGWLVDLRRSSMARRFSENAHAQLVSEEEWMRTDIRAFRAGITTRFPLRKTSTTADMPRERCLSEGRRA